MIVRLLGQWLRESKWNVKPFLQRLNGRRGVASTSNLGDEFRRRLCPHAQYFVHAGNVILLMAVNMTDVLAMRVMMATASTFGICYNLLQYPKPLLPPALWGGFFVTSHVYNICKLCMEEPKITMTQDEEKAYEMAFLTFGFTPRRFLDIMEHADGKWNTFEEGSYVHKKGDALLDVHYVMEGEVQLVSVSGDDMFKVQPGKGGWVGEFFDPNASADAWQKERKHPISYKCTSTQCRTLSLNRKSVEEFVADDKALKEAATKAEVADLWGKLHRTLPDQRRNTYKSMIEVATSNGYVDPYERKVLDDFRDRHKMFITDDFHENALSNVGWTPEDWTKGKKSRKKL